MTFRIPRRGAIGVTVLSTTVLTTAVLTTTVLTLVGCGSADSGAGRDAGDATLSVVVSTDVWGSVVETVAGETVEVSTLIDLSLIHISEPTRPY